MKAEGVLVRRRGVLFIISGPSGAGKTSVSSHILENMPGIEWSVSVTTRSARKGETPGVHYDFVSAERLALGRHDVLVIGRKRFWFMRLQQKFLS